VFPFHVFFEFLLVVPTSKFNVFFFLKLTWFAGIEDFFFPPKRKRMRKLETRQVDRQPSIDELQKRADCDPDILFC